MGINNTYQTTFTTGVLIGDTRTVGSITDAPPVPTQSGGTNISAALEVQSTLGGFVPPRMTAAQIAAIVTPLAGMQVFNTDTNTLNIYQNGAWVATSAVNYVTGTLTLAQFLATNSAPITIAAAPGAGLINHVNQFTLQMVYGSAALVDGGAVALYYSVAGPTYTIATNAIAAATLQGVSANTLFNLTTAFSNAGTASANTANAALVLRNPTANFTVGTGATFRYNLIYSIIPST